METRKQSPREAYKVITTYLRGTANLKLFKGQTVKCRILSIKEKHPRIELVDISEFEQNKANLDEEKLTELLSKRELTWNTKEFIRLLLSEENEKSFESQCHRWIQNLINKKIDLTTVRMDCSDILELSELLDLCPTYWNFLSCSIFAATLKGNTTRKGLRRSSNSWATM